MSPAVQSFIDKGLFDRLPPTFSTFVFEQIKDWDLLFPAEQSYFERLLSLLDRSDPKLVDDLFAPMRAAEREMGINEKTWPRRSFTLDQVDFLNRNLHYAKWRKAVASAFARLDPALEEEVARRGQARLVIVTSPAELPTGPDRMWTRLQKLGKRVRLEGEVAPAKLTRDLAAQYAGLRASSPYDA
ncbi:MAG: hypothetical protein ACRD7E_09170, partial [Bryobacteraceae bacterium]